MTKLDEALKELEQARYQYHKAKKETDKRYQALSEAKELVHMVLNDMGLKSAKTDKYTISIANSVRFKINNTHALIDWLKNTPDVEADNYITVDRTKFNTLAKQVMKQTGEIPDGVDYETSEYISLRSNK